MIAPFGRILKPPFGPRLAAAGDDNWWLSGGIVAANCIAAYQPIGADDIADSYINVANSGTYNATPGTAPTWDAVNGWKFLASSSQYLGTGGIIVPNDQTWSIIIKYSNYLEPNKAVSFSRKTGGANTCDFGLYRPNNDTLSYYSGSVKNTTHVGTLACVQAIAGNQPYLDGATDGATITAGADVNDVELVIGAINIDGSMALYFTGHIQAYSLYNTAVSGAQVAAVGTAMNAL